MTNRSSERHRGRRDQAARAALAPTVEAGLATCWACGSPILPGQEWDAGHTTDLLAGGAPGGQRLPEHRRKRDCEARGNRSRGSRAMHDRRRGSRLRPDAWQ